MIKKHISQKEIARRLNISQAVVSMVLSGKTNNASEKTRNLIINTAKELGYFYKNPASNNKKYMFCLIVDTESNLDNPHFQRFLNGCQKETINISSMITYHSIQNGETIPPYINSNADGFIITCKCSDTLLSSILPKQVVFMNSLPPSQGYDCIMPDNEGGIQKAVEYLIENGHRNIAYFGIREFGSNQKERYKGFLSAAEKFSLPNPKQLIFIPFRKQRSMEDVERLVRNTLKQIKKIKHKPTALVCETDLYAVVFYKIAPEFNMKIPEDLSIIGFDNTTQCTEIKPNLTSIDQPMEFIGGYAVKLLKERIETPVIPARMIRCELDIKYRDSVKNILTSAD